MGEEPKLKLEKPENPLTLETRLILRDIAISLNDEQRIDVGEEIFGAYREKIPGIEALRNLLNRFNVSQNYIELILKCFDNEENARELYVYYTSLLSEFGPPQSVEHEEITREILSESYKQSARIELLLIAMFPTFDNKKAALELMEELHDISFTDKVKGIYRESFPAEFCSKREEEKRKATRTRYLAAEQFEYLEELSIEECILYASYLLHAIFMTESNGKLE